jgi:integrase
MASFPRWSLGPRTLDGYRGYIERSVIPHIGTIHLSKPRPDAVEAMEKALVKVMSPTSVVQVHRILRKALQDALRWDLVARNVADVVTPPRKATPEMKPLTPEQLDMLLTEADGTQLGSLFHLDAQTGLRRAELCGLKWSDVDLDQGTLGVQRTISASKGKGSWSFPQRPRGPAEWWSSGTRPSRASGGIEQLRRSNAFSLVQPGRMGTTCSQDPMVGTLTPTRCHMLSTI